MSDPVSTFILRSWLLLTWSRRKTLTPLLKPYFTVWSLVPLINNITASWIWTGHCARYWECSNLAFPSLRRVRASPILWSGCMDTEVRMGGWESVWLPLGVSALLNMLLLTFSHFICVTRVDRLRFDVQQHTLHFTSTHCGSPSSVLFEDSVKWSSWHFPSKISNKYLYQRQLWPLCVKITLSSWRDPRYNFLSVMSYNNCLINQDILAYY